MNEREKKILTFILTQGEVAWGQLVKNLVRVPARSPNKEWMAQGTLSKYKRSLEKEGWIEIGFDSEGKKVYFIPEDKLPALKNLVNALTPQEQINFYKSLSSTRKRWWLDTLKVVAEAPDVETLKKKQKAAKRLLKAFKKE